MSLLNKLSRFQVHEDRRYTHVNLKNRQCASQLLLEIDFRGIQAENQKTRVFGPGSTKYQ